MSVVTYNNVILPYSRIVRFNQEAVYEESGTDWYCTKFDIEVECVISANYASLLQPNFIDGVTTNAADFMDAIRTKLLKPRKTLSVLVNGVNLIPQATAGGANGTVDAVNGPQPKSCVLTQLTSTTFLMQYHIVANYWENNTTNPATTPLTQNARGNPVLYNRWTERVEINHANFTRRIREGKFMIRSDNAEGLLADQLRTQMAVVGVPDGFNRESSTYTVDPSGLAIQYQVIDQEVYKNPPSPAFRAQGTYSESSTRGDAKRYGEVWVRLEGDKSTDQAALVRKAVSVATSKLDINGAPLRLETGDNRKLGILEMAVVTVGMYENWVDCRMRAMIPQPQFRVQGGLASLRRSMTHTPFSRAGTGAPAYRDRGTASLVLQAAAYYDPSLRGVVLSDNPQLTSADNPLTRIGIRSQLTRGTEVGKAGIQLES